MGATLHPGVALRVTVGQGLKGPQVGEVLEIDESTAVPPPTATLGKRPSPGGANGGKATRMIGTVKWYSPESVLGSSQSGAAAARCSFTPLRYNARVSSAWPRASGSRWKSPRGEKAWRRWRSASPRKADATSPTGCERAHRLLSFSIEFEIRRAAQNSG